MTSSLFEDALQGAPSCPDEASIAERMANPDDIGFVYFAGLPYGGCQRGPVKVGFSKDPIARSAAIGRQMRCEIKLIAAISVRWTNSLWGTGKQSLEQYTHRFLRSRGLNLLGDSMYPGKEWYSISHEAALGLARDLHRRVTGGYP